MIYDGIENRKSNYKILLIGIFALTLFITIKLFGMQLLAGADYRLASEGNGIRVVPIAAPRGIIKDRNGTVLVKNRPSYSIYILPYEVKDMDSASVNIATALGEDPELIKKRIINGWKGRFQPIRLKRDIDFKTVCYIEEHALDYPGILFQVEPKRLYPVDNFGTHIWGYVGEITESDLAKEINDDYLLGDVVGKEGLEKKYENHIKGVRGTKLLEVTASGKVLGEISDKERKIPVQGAELQLEIDWELQIIAEEELKKRGSGAVVVIDPRDGAVRVIASVPNFDANLFSGVVSQKAWDAVMSDSLHPLFNRSIKGTYPPGSIIKPFTAAPALEVGLIDPQTYFEPCLGAKKFGNRSFRCWKPGGHGRLNLAGALIQSCDVYFYQLGVLEGVDLWSQAMDGYYFGVATGIDLPGEFSGLVPSTEYYNKRYGKRGWTKYLVLNLSIGQGELLVTPLQMAVLYAALGNKGTIYKPRIVSKIKYANGRELNNKPHYIDNLPISKENMDALLVGLKGVITHERGTARVAALPHIEVAGKTGTAQNPHGDDHAWFACFAPADNPEIAIVVLVENAGHGGSIAAPLAKKLLDKYFGTDSLTVTSPVFEITANE